MTSKNKTTLGMPENIEALLAYVLGWITGIVFLVLEKDSVFVRFHAMQSLLTFLGLMVIGMVLGVIPLLGWFLGFLLNVVGFIFWILGMVKAFQGQRYHFPIVGKYAEQFARRK